MDSFDPAKIDSSEGALTPEGIEFVFFPAGPLVRACAYAIDQVIQWTITVIILISTGFLGDIIGWWLFLILIFCVDWFYHVICETAFHGQSPGKKIMGIRVVRGDGSPEDYSSSFLRNLLRFADTFFFFCPIALISMMASRGFRRLGDWAGNTLVVYTHKNIVFEKRLNQKWLSGVEPIDPCVPLSYEEKQLILMFARRYPLLGEARANEIAGVYVKCLRNKTGQDNAAPKEDVSGENACAQDGAEKNISDAAWLLGVARKLAGTANEQDTAAGKNAKGKKS